MAPLKHLLPLILLHRVNNTFISYLISYLNRYCNDLDIKLVFTTFKLRNLFSMKDSVPRELRSRVIYKCTCVCCNACYIGETGRHFSTRVREHFSSGKSSYIFKHLQCSEHCRQSGATNCFEILDSAPTEFQSKLKGGYAFKLGKAHVKSTSSSRQPDTYTLSFIFNHTLCISLKYGIYFCHLIIINYTCLA